MSTQIQKVLDGEVDRDRLRSDELAELEAFEEALDGALAPVRHEAPPDVTRVVAARIRALPRHRPEGRETGAAMRPGEALRRAREWLLTPKPIAVRPAWAMAAVAVAALLIAAPWRADGSGATGIAPVAAPVAADPDAPVVVRFTLRAPGASSVQLAGDFTDWQPAIQLAPAEDGVWTAEVPVRPGVHQYSFVVDGQRWVIDPGAPVVPDGFGGRNSRLDVLAPTPERSL